MTVSESTMPRPEDYDKLTPAMRQFIDIKTQYPETLVLFRMGDFYETFFDDAIRINKLIGITLTKRGKRPDGEPIPMAGIPFMTLDQYVARLVKLGLSLVIAEQVGTPGQGLMERRISRIITPGTLTDENLLPSKSDAILLAVAPKGKRSHTRHLVWLTLSNGDFMTTSVDEDALETEFARLAPSEVLVAQAEKTFFQNTFPDLTFTAVPDWHFDVERGLTQLKNLFELETLEAWGVADDDPLLAAANALLDYTEQTQVDMMPFIAPLRRIEEDDHIVLDAATRRNLELVDALRGDGAELTLFKVLDHCRTGMGSRELRRRLQLPLRDRDAVLERQSGVAALAEHGELNEAITKALMGLPDIERITSRIGLGTVRPKELAQLRDGLPLMHALSVALPEAACPLFGRLKAALAVPSEIHARLDAMLLEEPATFLRDGDVLKSEAHPDFKALRDMRDNFTGFLMEFEAREKERTGLASLRVQYNKVQGFYIELPKGQAKEAPIEYHRQQTLKNVERFTTPELKQHENDVLGAKERTQALEKELYEGLVEWLNGFVPELMLAAKALAELDVTQALATHAQMYHWTAPELSEKSVLDIEGGRHPVVETVLETYVPNDCRLGDGRRCLIITGPNMGGKSTYMRSVALIALLAWIGSFVPARHAVVGAIDRIHTRIGASDDLARGRSTFMVEMTEAATILHQATDRSLVLMDEIGRGTATFDGLSLAGAIAEELVTVKRSLTLFATHYFELTQLGATLSEAANVHVSAVQNKNRIVFLHEIQEGPASRSYGIAVAQLAGVPASVVRRARTMMQTLEERESHNASPQADLFGSGLFEAPADRPAEGADRAEVEALEKRIDELEDLLGRVERLDTDLMTPRDAMRSLYELQELAAEALKKDCAD